MGIGHAKAQLVIFIPFDRYLILTAKDYRLAISGANSSFSYKKVLAR
jgi:hypothetical protein